ncbi:hypothetical protein [Hyphomonas sp.]|uniref:hypothetical protein n=1 Tax=Hyphomonas sp. TaxID=87 RepID=UPI0039193667
MSELIGLAASAAGGGVFGLIGTLIGRAAGYAERRQDQAQERARWAHDAALAALHMQAAERHADGQFRLAEAAGAWRGLAASIEAEAGIAASYRWVDAVRGITRPALTLLLWLITCLVFLGADPAARSAIIETTTFAATAATLWWFGDRGQKREVR